MLVIICLIGAFILWRHILCKRIGKIKYEEGVKRGYPWECKVCNRKELNRSSAVNCCSNGHFGGMVALFVAAGIFFLGASAVIVNYFTTYNDILAYKAQAIVYDEYADNIINKSKEKVQLNVANVFNADIPKEIITLGEWPELVKQAAQSNAAAETKEKQRINYLIVALVL